RRVLTRLPDLQCMRFAPAAPSSWPPPRPSIGRPEFDLHDNTLRINGKMNPQEPVSLRPLFDRGPVQQGIAVRQVHLLSLGFAWISWVSGECDRRPKGNHSGKCRMPQG